MGDEDGFDLLGGVVDGGEDFEVEEDEQVGVVVHVFYTEPTHLGVVEL